MSAVDSLLLYRQKTWVSGRMMRTITSIERIAREYISSRKSAERSSTCTNAVDNSRPAKSGGIDMLGSAASGTAQDVVDGRFSPFSPNTSADLEGMEPARAQQPDRPCQPSQLCDLQIPTLAMSDFDFEQELGSAKQDTSTSDWLDSFDSDLHLHLWDTDEFC